MGVSASWVHVGYGPIALASELVSCSDDRPARADGRAVFACLCHLVHVSPSRGAQLPRGNLDELPTGATDGDEGHDCHDGRREPEVLCAH